MKVNKLLLLFVVVVEYIVTIVLIYCTSRLLQGVVWVIENSYLATGTTEYQVVRRNLSTSLSLAYPT